MKRSSSYFTQPLLQIYPIFSSPLHLSTIPTYLPTYLPESSHMWIALVSHSKSSERIEGLISTDTPPSRGATSFDAHEYVILSSLDQDMPSSRFKIYRITEQLHVRNHTRLPVQSCDNNTSCSSHAGCRAAVASEYSEFSEIGHTLVSSLSNKRCQKIYISSSTTPSNTTTNRLSHTLTQKGV